MHMEEDDPKLSSLLREWQVPGAPASLEPRVLGRAPRQPWWKFLFTGSIRLPVPVGLAVAALVVVLAIFSTRPRSAATPAPAPNTINLKDFQPVEDAQVRILRGGEDVPK